MLFVYSTETGVQRPVCDELERDLHGHWDPRAGSLYPQYAWFPDGRHIVIWAKGKLHKINVDTQVANVIQFRVAAEHRITAPPRFENALTPERLRVRAIRHAVAAPDGTSVTFNALGRLWQQTLPHGKSRRVTTADHFEFEPAYSRDGTRIAYVSWSDEQGGALHIRTTNGRHLRTLVKGAAIVRQPAFSPDGSRVAYWLEQGNVKMGGYRAINAGLYWLSLADGQPRFVSRVGKRPQFSPMGNASDYVTHSAGSPDAGAGVFLESVTLDGLHTRRHVTSEEAGELGISPDLAWGNIRAGPAVLPHTASRDGRADKTDKKW